MELEIILKLLSITRFMSQKGSFLLEADKIVFRYHIIIIVNLDIDKGPIGNIDIKTNRKTNRKGDM